MMNFETIVKMTQLELKQALTKELTNYYNHIEISDGYIYAKGELPIMLVAHMDTVHDESVKEIIYTQDKNGNTLMSSPQGIGGDDRCGIFMALKLIESYKCHVLFAEDEEIGCVGAEKFTLTETCEKLEGEIQYIIELDRKGNSDAVFYDCDNPEFTDFIVGDGNDFTEDYGSFTDICTIAPVIGAAAVNLSCGYYNAHTLSEYINLNEMEANIKKVKRILDRTTEDDWYEFIEKEPTWDDLRWGKNIWTPKLMEWYILAETKEGEEYEDVLYAGNPEEAVGKFLMNYPELCYNDIVQMLSEEDFV